MKKNELLNNLKKDLPAGLVVYLVALPLCLGIALASTGRTDLLFSGIIAGVVGGIVVGALSGSAIGVSGPAAGLVTIVIASITSLGSFEAFLVAVVLAGILQVIAGFFKAGVIGYYFPSSVVKGMLAAIGLILILKQIPHAFGFDKDFLGDETFFQKDGHNTFSELYYAIRQSEAGAVIISVVSLVLLILFDLKFMKKFKLFKFLPGALFVVVAGIGLNILFSNFFPQYALSGDHVVGLPVPNSLGDIGGFFTFPDFNVLQNPKVYLVALTIAMVASLETLLSVEATDKLDPEHRRTPTNRELKAQGVGNIISGLIGGLPITQVIVRSSANANSGGKTKSSTIFHGIILLGTVLVIPHYLNLIPLSALATLLIVIGYKLSKPSLYVGMMKLGWEQFVPFFITVIAVIFTDLLVGIGIGLALAIYFILKKNYNNSFRRFSETANGVEKITFRLSEEVSFLNKASISLALENLPQNSTLIIDGSKSKDIDFDVLERIDEFKKFGAIMKNVSVETVGVPEIKEIDGFKIQTGLNKIIKKMRTHTQQSQAEITPDIALSYLKEGNNRFVENLRAHRNLLNQANETSDGQYPFATILSCIDSRTSAELIFDQGLGDIFSVRIAGNVVNDDILGSMEYACKVAGSKLIVVLGHSKCGAIASACNHVVMGNITSLLSKIQPSVQKVNNILGTVATDESVQRVADENVLESIRVVHQRSSILNEMNTLGEIKIVGAMYDIESGRVEFFD